jgi:hypothetical protein
VRSPSRLAALVLAVAAAAAAAAVPPLAAQEPTAPEPAPPPSPEASGAPVAAADLTVSIRRATGEIVIDGSLDDPGWRNAVRVDRWFETNPGDNVEPKVVNVAWLAYDDRYLYAAFDFADPEPGRIRAPFADRDNVPGYTDYGGVIVDTRRNGTAAMFLANPRGVQYDAISSDSSGEDSSPDFFWDSAGRITETGWQLEIRIPFSSLRYDSARDPVWGLMLYRNWPRDRRYQMFTVRLPRDTTCFICNAGPLEGLAELPSGSHWVVAPYVSGRQSSAPEGGLGTPLETGDPGGELGADLKWVPTPDLAVDATVNPDFSQIEADVPQIAANERFALFFPEKRPFFLEGVDLLSTPVQAVYTRTVTAPRWGARATGRFGETAYTALVTGDSGGGSVIIPGAQGSSLADQDFESTVAVTRLKHDVGSSFVSLLATAREVDGGGYNRVAGPDFRWRPDEQNEVAGQFLWAETETPDRPDLADEWDGRRLSGYAGELWWQHQTSTVDWFAQYTDVAPGFRADNGFVPQVGYRYGYGEVGRSWHPTDRWVSRLRTFVFSEYSVDRDGDLLLRRVAPGVGIDGKWNSFWQLRPTFDEVRSGEQTFDRNQVRLIAQVRPAQRVPNLYFEATVGDEVDFANDRPADGGSVYFEGALLPTDHLDLSLIVNRRWLDVDDPALGSGRLLTADVARLRASYTFSRRMFLRLIGQWVETRRDPALYLSAVQAKSGGLGGSALLAYKLSWQTVFFLGFGDQQDIDAAGELQDSGREVFLKVSYALQR